MSRENYGTLSYLGLSQFQYSTLFAVRQSRVDVSNNRLKCVDVPNTKRKWNSHIPANTLTFLPSPFIVSCYSFVLVPIKLTFSNPRSPRYLTGRSARFCLSVLSFREIYIYRSPYGLLKSSRIFENEPGEIYSYLSGEGPKGRFFAFEKAKITLRKEKEMKNSKSKEKERRRKENNNCCTLSFVFAL